MERTVRYCFVIECLCYDYRTCVSLIKSDFCLIYVKVVYELYRAFINGLMNIDVINILFVRVLYYDALSSLINKLVRCIF